MEIDDLRTPEDELGPQVAAGRDATIHALGADLVLRRIPGERDQLAEAAVMEHVRAAGYPVPEVVRVGPGEMVMARIEGPTMLADLEAHPWRLWRHARTLADLHARLAAIDAPPGLRRHPVAGDAIVHQDLHPGNVICSSRGPMVIDWTNAMAGDPAADVAMTWIIMASSDLDVEPATGPLAHRLAARVEREAIPWIRRRLVSAFLAATGLADEARVVLGASADQRLADPNVRPGEAAAIRALVSGETGDGR